MYTKGQYVHEKMLTVFQCEGNENHKLSYPKYLSHPLEWLESKRQMITSVDEDLGKVKTLYTASGNIKCHCHFGKH